MNLNVNFTGAALELPDRGGKSPLLAAAENGHYEVVKILISHGAQLDRVGGFERIPLEVRAVMNSASALARTDMEEMKDPFKNTAFLKACWGGHLEVVDLLLNSGCNSQLLTDFDNSPLHICCLRGHDLLVDYLVRKSFPLNVQNQRGEPPLHTAVRQLFLVPGNSSWGRDSFRTVEKIVKIIEVLIKAGSDVKIRDNKDQSALYKLLTGNFSG